MRVRYDHLADPETRSKLIESLYEFMGVRYTEDVEKRVQNFLSGKARVEEDKNEYMSTNKNESFDPYHWKHDLKKKVGAVRMGEHLQTFCFAILGVDYNWFFCLRPTANLSAEGLDSSFCPPPPP
jgi:hypothetical protein